VHRFAVVSACVVGACAIAASAAAAPPHPQWLAQQPATSALREDDSGTGTRLAALRIAAASPKGAGTGNALHDSPLRPEDFGATGDGRTDDTDAVARACRAGRNIVFSRVYLVRAPAELCTFGNIAGVTLTFLNGSAIKYDPSQPWIPGASWAAFRFSNVTDVSIRGHATFLGNLRTTDFSRGTYDGPIGFYFVGRARNIRIQEVTARGIGQPIQFDRRPSLKAAYVASVGFAGSGYQPGDVLTVTGGTPRQATQVTVNTVDGRGGITATAVLRAGMYPGAASITVPAVAPEEDGVALSGGAGAGARLNIQWQDADESSLAENIVIDKIDVDTAWYGFSLVYQGRAITVRRLVADNVYRAVVAYGGLDNVEINVVLRNHYGDAVAVGSSFGLGMNNTRLNVGVLPQTALGGHSASKIRVSWANSHPAVFSDVHIRVNCDYGTGTNRGGSLVEFDKEDDKGRGRLVAGFTVAGTVLGTPGEDSGLGANLIGTNLSRRWSAGDAWKSIVLGPLDMRPPGRIAFDVTVPATVHVRAK
jgi:hypothetical protein